jgi:hypothetical protein
MTISASGAIGISDINIELRRPWNSFLSISSKYPRILAEVPTGPISISDFFGKSAGGPPQIVPGTMDLTVIIPDDNAPTFNWLWSANLINLNSYIITKMPVEKVWIVSDSGGYISNGSENTVIDTRDEDGIFWNNTPREQFLAGMVLTVGGTGRGTFFGQAIVRAENLVGLGNACTLNYVIQAGSGDGAIG